MMAGYASDEDTPVKHKPKDRGLARTETGMRHLPILQCAALPWQARQRNAGQAIDRARRPWSVLARSVSSRWISVKWGVGYEWATAIWGMGVCSSCRTSGLLWGIRVCPDRLGPVSLHNGNFTVRTVRRGVPRRRRWLAVACPATPLARDF
jgi:hypothetical protein